VQFHAGVQWVDEPGQKIYEVAPFDVVEEAVAFVQRARLEGGNALIHCAQGKSRSSTLLVAYLFCTLPCPSTRSLLPFDLLPSLESGRATDRLSSMLGFVQSKRVIAQPNDGFAVQLLELLQSDELPAIQERMLANGA
jgi:hypothetical protein